MAIFQFSHNLWTPILHEIKKSNQRIRFSIRFLGHTKNKQPRIIKFVLAYVWQHPICNCRLRGGTYRKTETSQKLIDSRGYIEIYIYKAVVVISHLLSNLLAGRRRKYTWTPVEQTTRTNNSTCCKRSFRITLSRCYAE